MNIRALKLLCLSLICVAALAQASLAQASPAQNGGPIEGTYNVTASSAELGTINFLMILKRDGAKWTAEIKDSPTPLTASSVTIDDTNNKITVTADAGGTTVTINGKFDKGEFAGDWSAGDIKGTWKGVKKDAAAASKPAPAPVSAEVMAALEGTYEGKIGVEGQGELPITFVVKRNGDKLVTEVPNAGDLNIVGIDVKEDGAVTLSATYQGNPFQLPGKRTGNEMGGKWSAGGFSGDWSAKKK